MDLQEDYTFIDGHFKKRVKAVAWSAFSLILFIDVAAVVLFVLFPDYWGVELLGGILFTVIGVIYILLNGLFYADKFCFKVTQSAIHVRRVIATDKYSVYRFDWVDDIKVKCRKTKFGRFYDLKFYTQNGKFKIKYLSEAAAHSVLSPFAGRYDQSILSEQA